MDERLLETVRRRVEAGGTVRACAVLMVPVERDRSMVVFEGFADCDTARAFADIMARDPDLHAGGVVHVMSVAATGTIRIETTLGT